MIQIEGKIIAGTTDLRVGSAILEVSQGQPIAPGKYVVFIKEDRRLKDPMTTIAVEEAVRLGRAKDEDQRMKNVKQIASVAVEERETLLERIVAEEIASDTPDEPQLTHYNPEAEAYAQALEDASRSCVIREQEKLNAAEHDPASEVPKTARPPSALELLKQNAEGKQPTIPPEDLERMQNFELPGPASEGGEVEKK